MARELLWLCIGFNNYFCIPPFRSTKSLMLLARPIDCAICKSALSLRCPICSSDSAQRFPSNQLCYYTSGLKHRYKPEIFVTQLFFLLLFWCSVNWSEHLDVVLLKRASFGHYTKASVASMNVEDALNPFEIMERETMCKSWEDEMVSKILAALFAWRCRTSFDSSKNLFLLQFLQYRMSDWWDCLQRFWNTNDRTTIYSQSQSFKIALNVQTGAHFVFQ